MTPLIGVELFKLQKRWLPWILLAGMSVLLIVGQIITYVIYSLPAMANGTQGVTEQMREAMRATLVFPGALAGGFDNANSIGTPLLIALAAVGVGSEFAWGTLRQMLTKGAGRGGFLVGKIGALALVAAGFTLISVIVGAIMGAVTTQLVDGSMDLGFLTAGFLGKLGLMFLRTWFAIVVYVLLAVFIAVATRSTAAGVAVGILYFFVESGIVGLLSMLGGWAAEIRSYLLGHNVQALLAHNRLVDVSGDLEGTFGAPLPIAQLPGQLNAILVLLGYCILFAGLSLYMFRKRDVTG